MKKITAVLVFIFVATATASAFGQTPKVAVLPFKNNGQVQFNSLASGISAMFTTNLSKTKAVGVVDPQLVTAVLAKTRLAGGAPSAEDAVKAAAALEADYVLSGEFVSFGNKFRIDIRLYEAKTGELKYSDKAQAKDDAFFDTVDELADKAIFFITGSRPAVGGSLQVISEPPGATVYLDGDNAGVTPIKKEKLPPGQHRVEMQLEGYQDYVQTVKVNENEASKVEVKLVRQYGGIRVWWKDVPTSDINISGDTIPMKIFDSSYTTFPVYCKNIPAGQYNLSVRLPSKDESSWENKRTWKTYVTELDVVPGSVTNVYINNSFYSPSVDVSPCDTCRGDWDFTTKISWYESPR